MAILRVKDDEGNIFEIPTIRGKDGYTPVKNVDYFDGIEGAPGKSAYEYAQESGYTGTEEEFAQKLAYNFDKNLDLSDYVQTVNGLAPDENGNVTIPTTGGGFSPIATVTQTDTGAVISITDKDGTTTATISNGGKGDKGDSGVYILAEGETILDAPDWAQVVVDPDGEIPSIDLVATLENGTTETYKLVVAE